MRTVLEILLYIDAVLLMLVILSQQAGAGMSETFGGGGGGDNFFRKKRGVEKLLQTLTITFGVVFVLLALVIPFSEKLVSILGL